MLALHYLRQPNFDADLVEQHLRNSFSAGDANYEERYVLGEFLFYRGQPQRASELFDYINTKAPPNFRKVAPRKESAITSLLGRYSGTVDGMKPQFFFVRSNSVQISSSIHYEFFGNCFLLSHSGPRFGSRGAPRSRRASRCRRRQPRSAS